MLTSTTNKVKKTNEGKDVYKTELSRITEKQQQQTPKEKGAKDLRGISQKKEMWAIQFPGDQIHAKLKQRDIILNCQRGSLSTTPQNSPSALLVKDINWIGHSGTCLVSIYQKASFIQQLFYICL